MIIFDQLRIADDGKKMYINAHVNKADYFDNVYIESITVITADKVSETAIGSPTEDFIYKQTFSSDTKELNLVIDKGVLDAAIINTDENGDAINADNGFAKINFGKQNFSGDLFFVYITCGGSVTECTPCRLDEYTTLGVTFDENLLFQKAMGYYKSLADDCNVPMDFVDFILQWNAFKAAVETEHYNAAIDLYKLLFENRDTFTFKGCGCHG